jgi:hypothetical protein
MVMQITPATPMPLRVAIPLRRDRWPLFGGYPMFNDWAGGCVAMTIATELAMPGRPLGHLEDGFKQPTALVFGMEAFL